jgi:hypothetical protein
LQTRFLWIIWCTHEIKLDPCRFGDFVLDLSMHFNGKTPQNFRISSHYIFCKGDGDVQITKPLKKKKKKKTVHAMKINIIHFYYNMQVECLFDIFTILLHVSGVSIVVLHVRWHCIRVRTTSSKFRDFIGSISSAGGSPSSSGH